jgi:hypothetical protein
MSEMPVDEEYEKMIRKLKYLIEVSKEFQRKEFIIGYEMGKELDPIIDKSVKRILHSCSELLVNQKDLNKMANWHDIQQQNLLPKSELLTFVEENRPAAASSFIAKYCDLSSSYYASCAKGFFVQIEGEHRVKPPQMTVLIGEVTGNGSGRRASSSFGSIFGSSTRKSSTNSVSSDSCNENQHSDIPFEAISLLIELVKREGNFLKEFFGPRRLSLLPKIFSKCHGIIKSGLKGIISENGDPFESLKMIGQLTSLEVKIMSISEFPTIWINEIQNILFENFKKLLRKQIVSLDNYPELKTTLSSSELLNHFVVKRFSNFMKNCLLILKNDFSRPFSSCDIELKRLENAFFNWIGKICNYIKDKRESIVFQLNNLDFVMESCRSIAGVDFLTSLKYRTDGLLKKFIKMEQEKYFSDLFLVLSSESDVDIDFSKLSKINSHIPNTIKAVSEAFNHSSFVEFSSLSVSETVRRRFAEETIALYGKYFEFYDLHQKSKDVEGEEIVDPLKPEDVERILFETFSLARE